MFKIDFRRPYSTKQHQNVWLRWLDRNTTEYWTDYLKTWDHPHRHIISAVLNRFHWISLFEIGCGSGPNLANILNYHKNKQLGGLDLNPLAIEVAQKQFRGALLKVGTGEDMP